MTNVIDFVNNKEFSTGESFPDGDTYLDLSKTEVKEVEIEYEGKVKVRYQLTSEGKTYFCGTKVMQGIKDALKKGFKKVRITKTGEGMKTNYITVGQP